MAILSVDLAHTSHANIGAVVLDQQGSEIRCELLKLPSVERPTPSGVGAWINDVCAKRRINIAVLDGPQGWKAAANGLVHSRCCERELNTPAKTGEPGNVKPALYTDFVSFSIAVFDVLAELGWSRLSKAQSAISPPEKIAVESFPSSAWTSLGIPPLPAKRKKSDIDVQDRVSRLLELFPVNLEGVPTHDELQALVAGLAGLALERGDWDQCRISGCAPVLIDSLWREGFIVNPLPNGSSARTGWEAQDKTMRLKQAVDALKHNQRHWAGGGRVTLDKDGYTHSLSANLFAPLCAETEAELRAGDGGELGVLGERGKCQALHSSSALACNFFDYWRHRSLDVLAQALDWPSGFKSMTFEHKFPHGVKGHAPNLDVVFRTNAGGLFAVESKFTEPYSDGKNNFLKPGYFASSRRVWADSQLEDCQQLAESLRVGSIKFSLLDAAQLLKHMLGLSKVGVPWVLCYLWFDVGGDAGTQHQLEIEKFDLALGADAKHFKHLSYQQLFRRVVETAPAEHAQYLKYLRQRYFA
jgi:hypothetical protein